MIKPKRYSYLLFVLLLEFGGCASNKPIYQEYGAKQSWAVALDDMGTGYVDVPDVKPPFYHVIFQLGGRLSRSYARYGAMYRAADITVQNHCDYFSILRDTTNYIWPDITFKIGQGPTPAGSYNAKDVLAQYKDQLSFPSK